MSKKRANPSQAAAPAATGNAGPQFEGKIGAFYLLSLLSGSEPRGLPGATIRTVEFQQRGSGRPLDDVVVQATNADGSAATLEIQAKRTLTFTASDEEFREVVGQMWEAAQKPEFASNRYELAVAIARTTTRVEHACQEVLHWARQLPDAETFVAHIARKKFASDAMRDFVGVFRANLKAAGAPTDDETVWRLLRCFQILPFDFESPGSDYEYRARERARFVLSTDQSNRAAELWPILIDHAGACARAGGARARPDVVTPLEQQHELRFGQRADLRAVDNRLSEAADSALEEIKDQVGGVRLARAELIDQAHIALEQHRMVHIVGAPGVGKSSVMKHLAERIQSEGRIIVLRNSRIIPGGWLALAQVIGRTVSKEELFNELGCGGGATLFIDNIDQIDDAGEWATVTDLLSGVAKTPGWRAVSTGGVENEDWKTKLPQQLIKAGIATLQVDPISDDETEVLSEGNQALAIILGSSHPARGIARNLFYLSRMIELGAGQAETAAVIATEMDLARLWWRYGGGRNEDDGRFARLKVLRAMGAQVISHPGRVAFKADDLPSSTVAELLRFDSLREDIKGATIAFRHDVLRDWTVGFQLHEEPELLNALPMDKPLPPGLARGLEIAARLALESDTTGARWTVLLAAVERQGCHGSWTRPVLLALPRSEQALALFQGLKSVLLESDGRRLSEIIRLMIAVESEPLAKLAARVQPTIAIPSGAGDLVVPKGLGWTWLVLWIVANAKLLPEALIPDIAKVFQSWLMTTQNQSLPFNGQIVAMLFEWLALIEEAMKPRMWRDPKDAPRSLNIRHVRDVRDEIRMSAFAFAHLNPSAAEGYLKGLDPDEVRHHEMQAILRAPGSLAKAAPAALVDFALSAIIEKEDPNDPYGSQHDRHGPFGVNDHLFSPASPGQGPFFEVLEHEPAEGLRLVRGLVEHATQWRREQYRRARRPFPRISIPFPDGTKSFEGDWTIYHLGRSVAPSVIAASALMALEAWAHRQIEAGRPFEEVFHDVLGPDGSSIAFVLVASDLVLSHWKKARDTAWPMVATPELLQFDDARLNRDVAGVDRILAFEQEVNAWRVKRADLDARPSRRARLSDTISHYVFHAEPERLEALRKALEQARNEIRQKMPDDDDNPINGLRATAERAVRMTNAEHWPLVKMTLDDGSEVEVHQFQRDPEETRLIGVETQRIQASMRHQNVRAKIQVALLDPVKSTAEIVKEGIEWAKAQPVNAAPEPNTDDAREDFNKEWDRRAVVMAAALAARDYAAPDRAEVVSWALPVLRAAASEKDKEYVGNDQIEYNKTAIAAVGLIALFLKDQDTAIRNDLLRLASHQHLAVVKALGRSFTDFARLDPRTPRSLIRIVMTSAIHPHRGDDEAQEEAGQQAYRDKVEAAITAEQGWLEGGETEPAWPELPPWLSRRRRSFRIDGTIGDLEDELEDQFPDHYADEHVLGALVGHLIRLTVGDLPAWVVELAVHLMEWTDDANGPHGEKDREREHRPYTWNSHFFEFLGILCVALPHSDVVTKFLEPIMRFKDEAFYDSMAEFLRGFDRAIQAIDTKKPENPVAVRVFFADRIRQGWNYKRLGYEKGTTSESHAGDALNAMFYQPPRFANHGRPSIPDNWTGLDASMPVLTALVTGAPTSGYLASLFLNLVQSSPRPALLPFVVQATTAWCSAYGVDTNFWLEKEIGSRVCAWLDRTFADSASAEVLLEIADELLKCLDTLIRSGIAQARDIEDRIAGIGQSRKTA